MREFLKVAVAMCFVLGVVLTIHMVFFVPGVLESHVKSEGTAETKSANSRCAVRQVKMPCFQHDRD